MEIWKTAIKDWIKQETTYFTSDLKHWLNLLRLSWFLDLSIQLTLLQVLGYYIKSDTEALSKCQLNWQEL